MMLIKVTVFKAAQRLGKILYIFTLKNANFLPDKPKLSD